MPVKPVQPGTDPLPTGPEMDAWFTQEAQRIAAELFDSTVVETVQRVMTAASVRDVKRRITMLVIETGLNTPDNRKYLVEKVWLLLSDNFTAVKQTQRRKDES